MTRYFVDDATNWRNDAAGLSVDDFLTTLEAELMYPEHLPAVEADSLVEAARKALDALHLARIEPIHIVLLFDPERETLHRMRQVVTFEEAP